MGKIFDARVFLEGLFATPNATSSTAFATPEIRVEDLDGDWRMEWEERAAILEYDGGLPREQAEAQALRNVVQRMTAKPTVSTIGPSLNDRL